MKIKTRVILAAVAAILLSFILFACNTKLRTVFYSMKTDKIKTPVRVALITDLHSGKYGDGQAALIAAVDAQKPNVILFGGDIIDDVRPRENAMILINAMTKKYPCYYVSGNHEYWTSGIPKIKSELRDAGVIVLEGDCKTLKIDTQYINICGVDDPTYIGKYATVEQIKTVDAAADNKLFTILLSHRPELFDEYAKCDFDLVLSGHAHGGQWRIPGILNGLYAPGQGLFPKHAGGQYAMGDNLMIVSRGLARGGNVIPRIFNRPELVIIDLMQK